MRVLLRVPLSAYSGYGNDGIGLASALVRAGADVYLQPTHVSPPLPPMVAALLTKRLESPFDLLIDHTDPGSMSSTKESRRASTVALGWTMWEYTTFGSMASSPRASLRRRLAHFDAVLAYDLVSKQALDSAGIAPPVHLLQGGFDAAQWQPVERDWSSDRFGFCMVGQLHDRKDPFVAIEAFRQLKDEHPEFAPAELHLKTTVPGLHPAMGDHVDKLRVHYATWPVETLRAFYASQHCLLAPSRGEGKNVPALEFLATGGTVVATAWGGHMMWLRDEVGYKLDYVLRPVSPETPDCLSARAKVEHLKELMWHVFTHRDEARRKGELASSLIPAMCSWDAVVAHLIDRLPQIVPGSGDRVRWSAMERV